MLMKLTPGVNGALFFANISFVLIFVQNFYLISNLVFNIYDAESNTYTVELGYNELYGTTTICSL